MSCERGAGDEQAVAPEPAAPRVPGPARTPPKPHRGDRFELCVERLDERGRPRGRVRHVTGDYEVVLRRGVPGSHLRVRVVRRRGTRLEARLEEVLEPGPDAVAPRCRHFGLCGGCSSQDVAHAAQLASKRARIQGLLDGQGLRVEVAPCASGAPGPLGTGAWSYRNKMEFTFGRRWVAPDEPQGVAADFALGLHPAAQHGKVFDLLECPIQGEEMTAVVISARRLASEAGLAAWDTRSHEGLLRHLVLRRARGPGGAGAAGELMVVLVTSSEAPEAVEPYAAALLAAHPAITTLVQAINTRPAQVAHGELERVLHGSGHVTEHVAGLDFRLSPRSFFQTNTAGAEELVRIVREQAACGPGDVVHDLYCGTGLLGLALAADAGRVHGFELVEPAVADARASAERNGVRNARFDVGDVAAVLARPPDGAPPDVVVVDPPRAGLHPSVAPALGALVPRRLIYVSCNPRGALADLAVLSEHGLELRSARPLDLFPHTPHVECVFTLERTPA